MKVKQPKRTQQIAREQQHYTSSPRLPLCENCEHYTSVYIDTGWGHKEEKKRRCGIGGFAVKRRGTCACHKFNVELSVNNPQGSDTSSGQEVLSI